MLALRRVLTLSKLYFYEEVPDTVIKPISLYVGLMNLFWYICLKMLLGQNTAPPPPGHATASKDWTPIPLKEFWENSNEDVWKKSGRFTEGISRRFLGKKVVKKTGRNSFKDSWTISGRIRNKSVGEFWRKSHEQFWKKSLQESRKNPRKIAIITGRTPGRFLER